MAEKEYIERDTIYRRVKKRTNPYGKPTIDYESGVKVLNLIKQEPAADVVEVRHGEWKKVYDKAPQYVCTNCNHLFNNKGYKYCPNCGAKMDGERKADNE